MEVPGDAGYESDDFKEKMFEKFTDEEIEHIKRAMLAHYKKEWCVICESIATKLGFAHTSEQDGKPGMEVPGDAGYNPDDFAVKVRVTVERV